MCAHAYMYMNKWKKDTCISTLHLLPIHSRRTSNVFLVKGIYASQIRAPKNRVIFIILVVFHSMNSQGHFLRLLWQGASQTPSTIWGYDDCLLCCTLYCCWIKRYCNWYRPYKMQKSTYGQASVPWFRMFYIFEVLWDFVVVKLFLNNYLRAAYKGNCIIKQEIVHDKEEINQ